MNKEIEKKIKRSLKSLMTRTKEEFEEGVVVAYIAKKDGSVLEPILYGTGDSTLMEELSYSLFMEKFNLSLEHYIAKVCNQYAQEEEFKNRFESEAVFIKWLIEDVNRIFLTNVTTFLETAQRYYTDYIYSSLEKKIKSIIHKE